VQETYKFLMNGQSRYELFIKVQKDHNLPVLHLERLVDTIWAYWYSSLSKINSRYTEIIEVLSILGEEADQTARANGVLNEMLNCLLLRWNLYLRLYIVLLQNFKIQVLFY